jgi:hypothetical protein
MSRRLSTRRESRSSDSSAVSNSSSWSCGVHWMSSLRRLVTAAFADASGVRRSCPTAASSAVRIRSPSAMGTAAAAASRSRYRSRITAACAANAPITRWSSARSGRPRSASINVSPAGTSVSASCGRSHRSVPALATTVHRSAGPRAAAPRPGVVCGVRSNRVTEVRPNASRTRSSSAGSAVSPRRMLPARVPRVSDSAAARAACRVRRAARSTTELTRAATTTKTPRARESLVSLMSNVCSGGVK